MLTSWHAGSGRPAEGEFPAQAAWQPASAQQQIQAGLQGGERARRGSWVGRPRPLPRTRRKASSSITGWTRAVRLCSPGFGRPGPWSRFPSARLSSAGPPADSSAARSAGSRRSRHAGGRDRGTRARRGGGTRGGDAGARSRWRELRLRPSPACVERWHCQPRRSLATRQGGVREARDPGVSLLSRSLWTP